MKLFHDSPVRNKKAEVTLSCSSTMICARGQVKALGGKLLWLFGSVNCVVGALLCDSPYLGVVVPWNQHLTRILS